MLHGSALKAAIWCLTLIGLSPAIVLALAALAFGLFASPGAHESPGGNVVIRSGHWFQVGPFRVDDWHPRTWVATVLAVGIVLVVSALFVLLHVPRRD